MCYALTFSHLAAIKADLLQRLERWAKSCGQPFNHVRKIALSFFGKVTLEKLTTSSIYDLVEEIVVNFNIATLSKVNIQKAQNELTARNDGKFFL